MELNDTFYGDRSLPDVKFHLAPDLIYTVYFMVFPYVIILLCFVGIGCNVFCVKIFGRNTSTSYTTVLLLKMLAYADIVYLLICILSHLVPNVLVSTAPAEEPNTVVVVLFAASDTAAAVTIWIVVVVAFDRYLIVCRPQLTAKYSTERRARVAVCLVCIAMVIIRIPQLIEMFYLQRLRESEAYAFGYRLLFHLVSCKVLPLSLLIVLACCLRSSVHALDHQQHSNGIAMSRDSGGDTTVIDDQRELTITVNCVVIVFIILQSISTILQTYLRSHVELNFWYEATLESPTGRLLGTMFDGSLLVAISTIKIVFYGKRFAPYPSG